MVPRERTPNGDWGIGRASTSTIGAWPHLNVDTTCCTEMKTVQADVGEVQLKADTT